MNIQMLAMFTGKRYAPRPTGYNSRQQALSQDAAAAERWLLDLQNDKRVAGNSTLHSNEWSVGDYFYEKNKLRSSLGLRDVGSRHIDSFVKSV